MKNNQFVSAVVVVAMMFVFGIYWIDVGSSMEIMQTGGIPVRGYNLIFNNVDFSTTYHIGLIVVGACFVLILSLLVDLKFKEVKRNDTRNNRRRLRSNRNDTRKG